MTANKIYAEYTASISEAKANPNKLLEQAGGNAVAVLSHNKLRYYLVPSDMYEQLIDTLEALEAQSDGEQHDRALVGKFRPGTERMKKIVEEGRRALREAHEKELGEFEEHQDI
jgi:antitoxin StbD